MERACERLDNSRFSEDLLNSFEDILLDDWYESCDDLRAALHDGGAWTEIRLPGRLKLEMKKVIMEIDDPGVQHNVKVATHSKDRKSTWGKKGSRDSQSPPSGKFVPKAGSGTPKSNWVRKYAEDSGAYYYYDTVNGASVWEKPDDFVEPDGNGSNASMSSFVDERDSRLGGGNPATGPGVSTTSNAYSGGLPSTSYPPLSAAYAGYTSQPVSQFSPSGESAQTGPGSRFSASGDQDPYAHMSEAELKEQQDLLMKFSMDMSRESNPNLSVNTGTPRLKPGPGSQYESSSLHGSSEPTSASAPDSYSSPYAPMSGGTAGTPQQSAGYSLPPSAPSPYGGIGKPGESSAAAKSVSYPHSPQSVGYGEASSVPFGNRYPPNGAVDRQRAEYAPSGSSSQYPTPVLGSGNYNSFSVNSTGTRTNPPSVPPPGHSGVPLSPQLSGSHPGTAPAPAPAPTANNRPRVPAPSATVFTERVNTLIAMGFDSKAASKVLIECDFDVNTAAAALLSANRRPDPSSVPTPSESKDSTSSSSTPSTPAASGASAASGATEEAAPKPKSKHGIKSVLRSVGLSMSSKKTTSTGMMAADPNATPVIQSSTVESSTAGAKSQPAE